MALGIDSLIKFAWLVLGAVWLIGLAFTKRTERSQPVGFGLLAGRWFRQGWLAEPFMPQVDTAAVRIAGLALTIAGCLFAIWARVTLGGNWSGSVAVKAGHELVVHGPYALARHPIYTGLLFGALGTALAGGEWQCIVGAAVIFLALVVKISQEERLMMETFPDEYPQYRQRVKALIPGVL
jgi:protein-S-isoprenylcysteine O-methyltransferase Ste14